MQADRKRLAGLNGLDGGDEVDHDGADAGWLGVAINGDSRDQSKDAEDPF
jgi:hypothetical protein